MKRKIFLVLGLMTLLTVDFTVISCGNNDDEVVTRQANSEIYGRWMLEGYVDNGIIVSPDSCGTNNCYLSLEEDGSFNGRICNWFQGEYTFNRNGDFRFTDCFGTQIMSLDPDLMFMEEQMAQIKSFRLEGDELRLYYSDKDYLRFTR